MSNKKDTTELQLQRGIRTFELEGRKSPFAVQWKENGKRKTKTFDDEKKRDKYAERLSTKTEKYGSDILNFDPKEWQRWLDFKEKLEGASLDHVLRHWQDTGSKFMNNITIQDAVKTYLEVKEFENIAHDSIVHIRKNLGRFEDYFGPETSITSLTPDDARGWLEELKSTYALETVRKHRKDATAMYNHFIRESKVSDNPVSKVKLPQEAPNEITVLNIKDIRKLFKANKDQAVIGRLALEAFAGLRYTSARDITADDIKWKEKGIALPADKIKTKRRQYIDGLPDNLWKWLKHAPKEGWNMTARQYLKAKTNAFIRAQVPHPRNVLRHSFCSYHVALNKDAARTAVILCHTNPRMLYNHYKGVATEKDAEKYFNIIP